MCLSSICKRVIIIAVVLIFFGIQSLSSNKKLTLDFSCSSLIEYRDLSKDLFLNATVTSIFRPDGRGMISLNGDVNYKEKKYQLSRVLKFSYQHFSNHMFSLSENKMIINGKDTLPEGMFEKDFNLSSELYVSKISGIENAMLIGGHFSPFSVCIHN